MILVGFLLAGSPPAAGQEITDYDLFQLWNDCDPVFLVVRDLHDSAEKVGLTKQRIQTMAESRLRAARIYSLTGINYLYVRVNYLESGVFDAIVAFKPIVHRDWSSDHRAKTNHTQTWSTGSTGQSAGNSGFIMQSLSEHIDKFINEYLRVNAGSCN